MLFILEMTRAKLAGTHGATEERGSQAIISHQFK